jgi:hypothetical protein
MTYEEFVASLSSDNPPAELSNLLKALWYDGKGDWDMSHTIAQDIHDKNGSWIHAYLHRKEGDIFNAGYWYRQAGKAEFAGSLHEEWASLVQTFLQVSGKYR